MSFGQGGGGPFGGPPRDGGGTAGGQSGPFGAFGPFGGAPRGPGDDGDRGPGGPFGGGGSSAARGRGRPGRPSALVLTIIAVAVLVGLFVVFTNVYTDVLWFSQLGFTEVFWTEVVAKAALFLMIRQRHLHALDQAATSGRVPPLLLRRWEEAMEEEALWRFTPVPVHGDLHEDNLLLERGRVVGVTGWTDLHVGDPADDVAWLAAATDPDLADRVLDAYAARRADAGAADDGDAHLMRRAALLAEFALAQWLTRGLDRHDAGMVAEAEAMLAELEGDVRAAQEAAARQAEADAAADAAEDARDAAEDAREAAAARTADPETGPLPAVEVVRPINGGPGRP